MLGTNGLNPSNEFKISRIIMLVFNTCTFTKFVNVLELSMPRAIVHIILCACMCIVFIQSDTDC